jgi:thiol-disulfide isomerase/thioredoxin
VDPILLRLTAVALVVGVTVLVGRRWQARDGRVRTSDHHRVDGAHLSAVGLDGPEGVRAILLGSPTCSPCETVKGHLTTLASEREDFRWSYADAAEHPDLVAEHRVLRVPTLLIVGEDDRLVARTSGVPRLADLRRVLDGETDALLVAG